LVHRQILRRGIDHYDAAVSSGRGRFLDWQAAREKCQNIKREAVAPVHIVLARATQLVSTVDDAFTRIRERGTAAQNSYVCLITVPVARQISRKF